MPIISENFTIRDMPRIMATVAGFFANCKDEKQYSLEIKECKKKRSLDANAYFWALAHKISGKAGIEVTEVYRSYVKEIGGNNDIVCVQDKAVEAFCKAWSHNGLGWQTETMPSRIPGCTNVICYYGSSTYDTIQMSRLIGLAIQDCKEYGIEYLTERELGEMLAAWGGDRDAEAES